MKKIKLIVLLVVFLSFQKVTAQTNEAVVHGKVTNPIEGLVIRLFDPVSSQTVNITVLADGTFKETIKLKKATYFNVFYDKFFVLYLDNKMDLDINFDAKNISKTLSMKGKGEKENIFLRSKAKLEGELYGADYTVFLDSDEATFDAKMNKFDAEVKSELEKQKSGLDASFVTTQLKKLEEFNAAIKQQYLDELRNKTELGFGMKSPEFNDYINYNGGKASLKDFRGSYVFIDVWATWCGPCKYEMPFIGKVEKEFHGKNIKFVSISIDRLADEKKWRAMIVKEGLSGIQLLADNEIDSKFIASYYIQGIPRFIVLDKEGKIISSDAPRPSEPELTDLLNSLDL